MTDRHELSFGKSAEVDAFLKEVRGLAPVGEGRGRLIFALDATMSRQPTWDLAQSIQGQMFAATRAQGGLEVQLVYFRGAGECRASRFMSGGAGLQSAMAAIDCREGRTQIAKVLRHARTESAAQRVAALVFIGDACEESPIELSRLAGELGLLGVKAFMFQEGFDLVARLAFREIARVTGGAYATFDRSAPQKLAELLAAVAAYAVGGVRELERRAREGEAAAQLLLSQL
ncbi:MAG TPA: VWA domain-containing protein [Methylocystis sp.]|nr:VWA domain-containing protein [Methylocystis sp.]